jgi:hypothetical protein
MLLSVHAIEAAPPLRQPNINGHDYERRVIARASRTGSSSAREQIASPLQRPVSAPRRRAWPKDQAQASAMPLSARLVNQARA